MGFSLPILVYLLMMVHLGWREPLVGERAQTLSGTSSGAIYLYNSETNNRYYKKIGGDYTAIIKPWRDYFADSKRKYREVRSLSAVKGAPNSVLILPSALSLSQQDRSDIRRLQKQGISILTTWSTGTRDEDGNWVGYDFLQTNGVTSLGEGESGKVSRALTIAGDLPITENLLAGQRVWLTPVFETPLRLRGDLIAARITDWGRDGTPNGEDAGAVVLSENFNSRIVAFGFAETAWDASPGPMHQLIDNSLDWLQRQPGIQLADWPNGYRAAQLISMDTEHEFGNSSAFATMLSQTGLRGTFFVLTSMINESPQSLRTILAGGNEVGYHGDVHNPFNGLDEQTQMSRLNVMKATLATADSTAARQAIGFRAPTEGYDALTDAALTRVGLRYHAANAHGSESTLPFFLNPKIKRESRNDSLLILPRTSPDDLNFLKDFTDNDQLLQQMTESMNRNLRDGGFGYLSVHTQNFGEGMPLRAVMPQFLSNVVQKQKAGLLWVATGAQIDSWWRQRDQVTVANVRKGYRVEMDVTVNGSKPASGVTVMISIPAAGMKPYVRVTKVGGVLPTIRRVDDFRSQLIFPELAPGNYAYQLNFTKE